MVTASADSTAQVWEASTSKPVGEALQHKNNVRSAAFSPDGRRVVTAFDDGTAQVWDADTGKPVGAPLNHRGAVRSAAFSPDGRRVVTASADSTAQVWDVLLSCCDSSITADRLATLAEAVSGCEVSDTGSLTYIGPAERRERLRKLGSLNGTGQAEILSLSWIIRRFAPEK